jgi:hypothetical protein
MFGFGNERPDKEPHDLQQHALEPHRNVRRVGPKHPFSANRGVIETADA